MTTTLGTGGEAPGPGRPAGGEDWRVRPRPKRFLFCFPWVQSQCVRSQVLTSFLSGLFCFSLLAVYLGLTLTNMLRQNELAILIVLVILASAVFFCYSAVRLCLLVFRPDREDRRHAARIPDMTGRGDMWCRSSRSRSCWHGTRRRRASRARPPRRGRRRTGCGGKAS